MSQYNLDRIFRPRRVAVVGASEKTGSIGNALMKNLLEGGYKGMLLPVNPKYDTSRRAVLAVGFGLCTWGIGKLWRSGKRVDPYEQGPDSETSPGNARKSG